METPDPCASETEADYRVLCCLARCAGVDPADRLCPDLEWIAQTNGSLSSKANRFQRELRRNVRERRTGGLEA